jgi:murein DD-endopeptidase MepM/ murein hydrolase activator NlpD
VLRRLATAIAALACLCGPSLVISGPLLERMRQRTNERLAPRVAALPQYLPWTPGRAVHVNQSNHGRRTHLNDANAYGWDFGLPLGSEVVAGIAGEVESTGEGCHVTDSRGCHRGYGNYVRLLVADGTCASFLHLSVVAVRKGDSVLVGQRIGTSGSSGNSSGPHLHYEREDCDSRRSLETTFYEVAKPLEDQVVVSGVPRPG